MQEKNRFVTASKHGLLSRLQAIYWRMAGFLMQDSIGNLAADSAWQVSVIRIVLISSSTLAIAISALSYAEASSLNIMATRVSILLSSVALIIALWHSAKRPRISAYLILALVYGVGTQFILFNSIPEIVAAGAFLWFMGPIFVWMLVGTRQATAAMVLNLVPLAYMLGDPAPPLLFGIDTAINNGRQYVYALVFLLLSIALPLALFRMSYALRLSSDGYARTNALQQRTVALYRDMFEHAAGPVIICNLAGAVLEVNSKARDIFGLKMDQALPQTLSLMFGDQENLEQAEALVELARAIGTSETEVDIRQRDGRVRSVHLKAVLLSADQGLMVTLRDLTHLRQAQRELERTLRRQSHLEHHDLLTDLPNRGRVLQFLTGQLQRQGRSDSTAMVAMVSVRLNSVRQINEIFDATIGDQMIREFGELLASTTSKGGYLGRSHGVVFSLILNGFHTSSQLINHLEELRVALPSKLTVHGKTLPISISIGVAVHRDESLAAEELMRRSETALELARKEPDRPYVLFDQDIAREARRIIDLEVNLAGALERNELFLQYQPKVRADGKIVCLEALLRWRSAELGIVSPVEFIPIAEQTGQIHAITTFVIDTAFRQQRLWLDSFGYTWPVAINLSGKDLLREDISAQIAMAGYRHAIPPHLIQLEITETGIIENADRALGHLNDMAQRGFVIALDDFGTGYSSLDKLSEFPISTIKIDRSFVSAIGVHQRREQIVRVTLSLAKILKCDVVAEGVETDAQLNFLIDHGCDLFQGYLFYKPLDVGHVTELLAANAPDNRARLASATGEQAPD